MKGIFCLEGFWFGDHRDDTSVEPILDLVHRFEKVPFVYHRCATRDEFAYSISRWKTKAFHNKYPLLYLAFHGEGGLIKIGHESITLDDLAELLGDKCKGVVIYFGSCATLDINRRRLQAFMASTRALAVLGYRKDVNWMTSASFEILILWYLLNIKFDSQGIQKFNEEIRRDCRRQIREFKFIIESNEAIHFPRKRKIPRA
jgi:hypothetical protein